MKPYNHIPIWVTKRRLKDLERFYQDVQCYFDNSRAEWMVDGRIEEPEAREARSRINLSLQRARHIIAASRVPTVIRYTPPPAVGGYVQNIDLVSNIFNIGNFQISPDSVVGVIEQAIGVYRDDMSASWIRTLNPLWWIGRALSWFAALPFLLIGKAGFDSHKAQESMIGKLVSLVFYLIPIVASVLTILDLLDLISPIKSLVGSDA